jgi:dTDP-4-dehydrorhamnose reductase
MKVLVTGMSGMLGSDIVKIFASQSNYKLFGICRNKIERNNIQQFNIDITNTEEFENVLTELQPDIIIHTAAVVDVDKCETEKMYADSLHSNYLNSIIKISKQSYLIYISSDSVFNGKEGNYSELSQVSPLNYYAESKVNGENLVFEKFPNALVVRTNIYGFHNPPKPSLVEWAISKLQQNDTITGFNDVFFNPVYTEHLAEILLELSIKKVKGIINIGSEEFLNKYEFLSLLADVFNFDKNLIEEKSVKSINFKAERPLNTTLNTEKQKKILGEIPSIKVDLLKLKENYSKEF